MISSQPTKTLEEISSLQSSQQAPQQDQASRKRFGIHTLAWLCLLLACLGASIFSYQLFIVPQPASFAPDWANAQWVKAADSAGPVAYFRHSFNVNAPPNSAFVVIAANQVYSLYVNGKFVGSNKRDFVQGIFPRAYVYDVTSTVQVGTNVVAIRVANVDNALPSVRASFGIVQGNTIYHDGSGTGWVGTGDSSIVYPRYPALSSRWTDKDFAASSWRSVQNNTSLALNPTSEVNPLLYEHPLSQQWIGVGVSHDAYFVRQFSLPLSYNGAWLRLAATGSADVYINGNQFISWTGQAPLLNPLLNQDLAAYLSDTGVPEQPRAGLAMGIYNISPYLHAGVNTIAIHVAAPGANTGHSGQAALSSALSTDVLLGDNSGKSYWLSTDSHWQVSSHIVDGWLQGGSAVQNWSAPTIIARPGDIGSFYLPESLSQNNVQVVPITLSIETILGASILVFGLWLFFSLVVLRRFTQSKSEALAIGSLMYVPTLAFEGLLLALSRESQMPRPFPFTWFWVAILSAIVWCTALLLWLNTAARYRQRMYGGVESTALLSGVRFASVQEGLHELYKTTSEKVLVGQGGKVDRILRWLRQNWALVALVLIAIPLSCYNLAYEPYWQDELSSYYASRGILAQGLPFFPSGFLYPKSELYSYMLALWTTIFGQADGIPRAISVVEYLVSLPLIYIVGTYFFNKRIALLATAMLAFSPTSLVWSRQMRMYEQEQLMTLLTVFLFYVAIQKRNKVYLVYAAALSLVLTYLSHEEVFIALPGLLLAILVASWDGKHFLPSVMYQKQWWYAAIFCGVIIGAQLLVVRYSHPPVLGTDSSERPQVGFTTDNIPFYLNLLFLPGNLGNGAYPWITLNSILATLGCFWAIRSTDMRAKYCAVFLIASVLTIVLVFTATADRYVYAILPVYYLIGSYALLRMLLVVWDFARPYVMQQKRRESTSGEATASSVGHLSWPMKLALRTTVLIVCASVLVLPILPLSGYNLFVSKLAGFAYHRHYADYDATAAYMKTHLQKDDIVISIAPPNCTLFYVGKVDYFFSMDRALFLIEKNGSIVETASNAKAMLNQDDFQTVLASHSRIWIISDNGPYQASVLKRFTFPQDFHMVYEGYGSAVYYRGTK